MKKLWYKKYNSSRVIPSDILWNQGFLVPESVLLNAMSNWENYHKLKEKIPTCGKIFNLVRYMLTSISYILELTLYILKITYVLKWLLNI